MLSQVQEGGTVAAESIHHLIFYLRRPHGASHGNIHHLSSWEKLYVAVKLQEQPPFCLNPSGCMEFSQWLSTSLWVNHLLLLYTYVINIVAVTVHFSSHYCLFSVNRSLNPWSSALAPFSPEGCRREREKLIWSLIPSWL